MVLCSVGSATGRRQVGGQRVAELPWYSACVLGQVTLQFLIVLALPLPPFHTIGALRPLQSLQNRLVLPTDLRQLRYAHEAIERPREWCLPHDSPHSAGLQVNLYHLLQEELVFSLDHFVAVVLHAALAGFGGEMGLGLGGTGVDARLHAE